MSDIAISVNNISKSYQTHSSVKSRLRSAIWPRHLKVIQETWALKNICFEIKRGEAVAIIGRNGGGKSTLLEILCGTLTPTGGSVNVKGRISALLELGSGFNPEYSGRDNVILNGLLLGLTKEDIVQRFSEIELFAEIGDAIDRPVKTYSSGMTMRLAFAVQVLCDPEILIIDEALSVGDFFFQQKCLGYIRSLCEKGVTLIFVSHDMSTVRNLCNRGIFLSNGLLKFDGTTYDALHHYFKSDVLDEGEVESDVKSHFNQIGHENQVLGDESAIWHLDSKNQQVKTAKNGFIRAVYIFDAAGNQAKSFKLGEKVLFKIQYSSISGGLFHVQMDLKNKFNQIITSIGSINMKIEPHKIAEGRDGVFEFFTRLSVEAGEYSLSFSLSSVEPNGYIDKGVDSTPWIGPIQVIWNYQTDIPPFYGLVGLETEQGCFY